MTVVWAALSLGAVYAVIAMLFNVTIIGASVVNFAIPFVLVLCSYLGAWGLTDHGWPPVVVLIGAALVGVVICLFEELVAIRLLGPRRDGELVTTVGFATAILGAIYIAWGSDPRTVPLIHTDAVWSVIGGRTTPADVLVLVAAIILCVALESWTRGTRYGLASLARAEDDEAATIRGVKVRQMALVSFALSGALAGILGVVVGAKMNADAGSAFHLAILGFVAITIGGQRSYFGALVGGLVVAAIEYAGDKWLNTDIAEVMVLAIFAVFLLIRPNGLFGHAVERRI